MSPRDVMGTAPSLPAAHSTHRETAAHDREADIDSVAGADRRTRRAPWAPVLVGAVYVALAVAVYWHVWSTHPATVTQVGGDQYSNMWFLAWLPFAVAHLHNPFFSNFANFPNGVNLLTNTSSLFLSTLFSPVTVLWGPVAAFNAVGTLSLAGSAAAGYVFVREWTSWRPAAFVAGLVVGFGPYEIAQSAAGHINLTFAVFPPLLFLVAARIVIRQGGSPRRWGLALGLLATAQFFVSSEVLASSIVMIVIGVVVVAFVGRSVVRAHVGYALHAVAWALGAMVLLLSYPVWFALAGPAHINGPIQLVPQGYRADLLAPIVPDANQRFAPAHLASIASGFSNSMAENGLYLGLTLLAVLLVGAVLLWRSSAVVRVASVLMLAAFVLSLGASLAVAGRPDGYAVGLPLPERLLSKLPLLSNTVPARYGLYVALFAALLLGVILDRLHTRMAVRGGGGTGGAGAGAAAGAVVVPVVVAAIALVPLWPAAPFTALQPDAVPAFFTSPAIDGVPAGSVAVMYPYATSPTPEAQGWQAVASMHFRMPGGYFLVPDGTPASHIAFSPTLGYTRTTLVAEVWNALARGDAARSHTFAARLVAR